MSTVRTAIAIALLGLYGLFAPSLTLAEGLSQPAVAWSDYGSEAADQNTSIAPLPSQVAPVGYLEPSCCEDSCGECCQPCGLGDPWTLPQPCALQCNGITLGGWVSSGIYANAHGAASNGPLGFNDVGDGYTMNQLWIFAEKVADTGGCGTDWGFRADFVFGADGPDTQAFGGLDWDNQWDTSRDYGSAFPQLYAEVAINDLSIKLGHFYTLIGWEVVTAPDNFFYSHAYTMYYAEPFTHTGVLASHPLGDATVYGGWTQGWDTGFDNTPNANTFLGGVSVPLGEFVTATWACTTGDFGDGAGDIYMNSLVMELTLAENLTYIFQHDLGDNSGLGAGDNQWYGINQYLQYQINERWAAGMRVEWFRDDDGNRIGFGQRPAEGNYYALTAGLNWKPHANVTLRPELRYDWFDGTAAAGNLPFNGGNSSDQFSGGFDAIFTF